MLVKVVQFQKRAELFVQLLSRDIGKLWGMKIRVGDPLKTLPRGFTGLEWPKTIKIIPFLLV